MINAIDHKIYALTQSPDWQTRIVTARIVAVALSILVPVEAAGRTAFALLKVAVYVVKEPFLLSNHVVKLIRDPSFTKAQFAKEEKEAFDKTIDPVVKALCSIGIIVLSPFLAIVSPRAMINFHQDLELAKIPELETNTNPAPEQAVKKEKPLLNEEVKKNIDEKIISLHMNKDSREKLQKYGLTPPNSILLHGPSNHANMKAAEYIAKELGKQLKFLDLTDTKQAMEIVLKMNFANDVPYITGKGLTSKQIQRVASALERLGATYIVGSKLHEGYKTHVKVEITLPNAGLRKEVVEKGLTDVPKEDGFDATKVAESTDKLTLKRLEQIVREIKQKIYQDDSKLSTKVALEVVNLIRKSKKNKYVPTPAEDFVGMEELTKIFDLYLDVLKFPEDAKEYGVKLPAGILLYGAPGCGKTYTAKHLCDYAKSKGVHLNFHEMKGSDVASKWKGEGMLKIRAAFDDAKKDAPTILFIDECEGLFPSREKMKDTLSTERTQELDEALQMIESAKEHGVIVVGATNHISYIDSAILRTGRFDYTFEVKPPHPELRRKMFEAKLKLRKCAPRLNLTPVVKNTEGFSASDIETVVNTAGLTSWKQKIPISQELLMQAVETVKSKKASVTTEPGLEPGQAPIMQDLKKGLDALRQFMGNLDGYRPQAAVANDAI